MEESLRVGGRVAEEELDALEGIFWEAGGLRVGSG